MIDSKKSKDQIARDFQEMEKSARELYPEIDESISLANNEIARTNEVHEFISLSIQTPTETASNQISS